MGRTADRSLAAAGRPAQLRAAELTSQLFIQWARSAGLSTIPEPAVSAIPPGDLRALTSHDVEERFLAMGLADSIALLQHHLRLSSQSAGPLQILDFGCGCGRLARFVGLVDNADVHVVDVNPDLVQWCLDNLPNVAATLGDPYPPLPFLDAQFDLILVASVFTHLSPHAAGRWIEELARILRPSGLMLITTHGPSALLLTQTSPPHQAMLGLDDASTSATLNRLLVDHFVFLPYAEDVVARAHAGPEYGNAFVDATWAGQSWANVGADLVEYVPGGLRGFQDVLVYRGK